MLKKVMVVLMTAVFVLCLFSGCKVEKEPGGASATPGQTTEAGNDTDISAAGFDLKTIKKGDKVSVFTVKSIEMVNSNDGSVASAKIVFTGKLSVKGQYKIESESCEFTFTDEYKDMLPFPSNAANSLNGFGMDADKVSSIYDDAKEGYAAVEIKEYTLTYSVDDGEWHAFADDFVRDENEYVVMQ